MFKVVTEPLSPFSESVAHSLALYRNHLEFYGYQVEEEEEDILLCRHRRKPNLILRAIDQRGVLVSTVYGLQNRTRLETLEWVNDLNADFIFLKAWINWEESSLQLETFSEGEYNRSNFALLLDNVEYDLQRLFHDDQVSQYLQ
ncbi:MAG: DNA mismatch repair protein [Pseudanabaenaceae cyanobacterium]